MTRRDPAEWSPARMGTALFRLPAYLWLRGKTDDQPRDPDKFTALSNESFHCGAEVYFLAAVQVITVLALFLHLAEENGASAMTLLLLIVPLLIAAVVAIALFVLIATLPGLLLRPLFPRFTKMQFAFGTTLVAFSVVEAHLLSEGGWIRLVALGWFALIALDILACLILLPLRDDVARVSKRFERTL